jgi:ribosomal protein L32
MNDPTYQTTDVLGGEEVAAHYRRMVDQHGAVRLQTAKLTEAFGYTDLTPETRESMTEHLWDAGLLVQPSLEKLAITPQSQLKIVDKTQVEASAQAASVRYAINPAGVALACIGALAMAIAAFLPLDEPGRFARVTENALIHHGGWAFLALGAGIAVSAYRDYSAGQLKWTVVVLGVIALGLAIVIGTNKGYRTLYPLNSSGEPETSLGGTVEPLGLAVYVAGAGACAAILGGWIMRHSSTGELQTAPDTLKKCPDCAETVQAGARVCKHCGYRFDSTASLGG